LEQQDGKGKGRDERKEESREERKIDVNII
jgi:hypothetical protein